jgi:hypothetical protein
MSRTKNGGCWLESGGIEVPKCRDGTLAGLKAKQI